MIRKLLTVTSIAGLAIACPSIVYGYIGPGLGAGVLAVVLGIFGSIVLAIVAMFWFPLKRLFGKKTKPKNEKDDSKSEHPTDDEEK